MGSIFKIKIVYYNIFNRHIEKTKVLVNMHLSRLCALGYIVSTKYKLIKRDKLCASVNQALLNIHYFTSFLSFTFSYYRRLQ